MKKRLLSILLSVSMLMTCILPVSAAEDIGEILPVKEDEKALENLIEVDDEIVFEVDTNDEVFEEADTEVSDELVTEGLITEEKEDIKYEEPEEADAEADDELIFGGEYTDHDELEEADDEIDDELIFGEEYTDYDELEEVDEEIDDAASIKNLKIILSKTSYIYDGKAKKPAVSVTNSKGQAIAKSNYTVKYPSGRKNVGTYSVKVKFKNKYTGTKTLKFKIVPKGTALTAVNKISDTSVKVKYSKQTVQTTGYQIQYSTNNSFKTDNKKKTVKKITTTSSAITGLTSGKTYYFRVRTYKTVNGTKYYSSWSGSNSVKLESPQTNIPGKSGKCGDNITWSLVNNTLYISGSGEMYDYDSGYDTPWNNLTVFNVVFDGNITRIGNNSFSRPNISGKLELPNSLLTIGKYAFASSRIHEISFGNNLKEIEDYAFDFGLLPHKDIIIPDSVITIGKGAFNQIRRDNTNATYNVVIGNGVTSIGEGAFRRSYITGDLIIGNSIKEQGSYAFYNVSIDGDLIFAEGTKKIEGGFSRITASGKLIIPDSVEVIGDNAFSSYDPSLYSKSKFSDMELKLPNSLKEIGSGAFRGCLWIKGELKLPDSLKVIGYKAFGECTNITGNLVFPSNLESIEEGAFSGCSGLDGSIVLNDGLTLLSPNAFSGCSNLKGELVIPGSLKHIFGGTFRGCSSFTSLRIKEGVKIIYHAAFSGLDFERISLPLSIEDIKYANFRMGQVYYQGTRTSWKSIAISSYGNEALLNPQNIVFANDEKSDVKDETYAYPNISLITSYSLGDNKELTYSKEKGYNIEEIRLNGSSVIHEHIGAAASLVHTYNNVELLISLPAGLSFSKTEDLKTKKITQSYVMCNKSFRIDEKVYTSDLYSGDFVIQYELKANGYEKPNKSSITIPITNLDAPATDSKGNRTVIGKISKKNNTDVKIENEIIKISNAAQIQAFKKGDLVAVKVDRNGFAVNIDQLSSVIDVQISFVCNTFEYNNGKYTPGKQKARIIVEPSLKKPYSTPSGLSGIMDKNGMVYNVDKIKLGVPKGKLNLGKSGLIPIGGKMYEQEKTINKSITSDDCVAEYEISIENDYVISKAEEAVDVSISVNANGTDFKNTNRVYITNIDYQRNQGGKYFELNSTDMLKAKTELNKLCNGTYLAFNPQFDNLLNKEQAKALKSYLYSWTAVLNLSTQINEQSKLEEKILKKIGLSTPISSKSAKAVTYFQTNTKYGKKTIEITYDFTKYGTGLYGIDLGAFGSLSFKIDDKKGIPNSQRTEGLLAEVTYAKMDDFLLYMKNAGSDAVKKVYKIWGDNADEAIDYLSEGIINEVMKELTDGTVSDNLFKLLT